MRLVIIDGPSLQALQLIHERKRPVEFVLNDRSPIIVCIDDIMWDRRPEQMRALIKGLVIGGKKAGSRITGHFNAVGAGLFDIVDEPAIA
jgi:sugar/nucleoside kinase (ribokinase family)